MGWDGAGNYSRVHNFSADASAGIKILASRMDAEINDMASAFTRVWTRDGQNTPTQDIPMGGRKFVNVGAPTSVGNFMRAREFIENVPIFMQDAETSADRVSVSSQYFTSVSANQAPVDGTKIIVRTLSNKSSAALYLDGHSANIAYTDGTRIGASALASGGLYEFLYSSADVTWRVKPDVSYYRRTAAEVSAGVTPTDYQYPELHFLRYAITGSASDQSTLIQSAISVATARGGGTLIAPKPLVSYNLGTTGITLPAKVKILGDNEDAVQFLYSGTGVAIDCSGSTFSLENIYLVVTSAAGSGIRFGNVCRRAQIQQVTVQNTYSVAADRTGAGFWFRTLTTDTAFSGDFSGLNMYSLGFKYGCMFDCFEVAEKTWTTCVFHKLFLVGPGSGVAGSIGIWCDSTSNMIGSSVFGGTIENFAVPIQVDNGEGYGINYYGDIEGNGTDNPSLAASYSGEIVPHNAGKFYRAGANGTTNRWMREQHLNGVWGREAWYGHEYVLYDNGGTAFFDLYRGDSKIDGGSPSLRFRIATGNSAADTDGNRNYIQLNGNRVTWLAAAPTSGTWAVGDVTWNTGAAAGGSPGWVCTTAGTPGTWKTMAVLAA